MNSEVVEVACAQPSALQSFEQWLNATESDRCNDPVTIAAVASLRQSLLDKLDQQPSSTDKWLTEAIKQTKAVFTCSGVIEIGDSAAPIDPVDGTTRPRSVQMAFKSPNNKPSSSVLVHDAETCYLSLPLPESARQSDIALMMSRILSLCQPAKFGLGGENVFDPTYRSCDQLGPDAFLTSFTPIDSMPNIVHEIMRVLCAERASGSSNSSSIPSLRAELYKLNVYSTGGKFRSHRDTPRSSSMVGSLVVCLPIPHEGGTLIVHHPTNGQSVKYEWDVSLSDKKNMSRIQWCAFYGDCPHAILPVTSGYRATLTYNLYLDEESNQQAATTCADQKIFSDPPAVSVSSAPFHSLLSLLLRSPLFMPNGGKLGIFCHHGYAHTSESTVKNLNPRMLKGGDSVIYEAARALGLKCDFVPVVEECVVLPQFSQPDTSRNYAGEEDYETEYKDAKQKEELKKVMGHIETSDITWLNIGEGTKELQEAHAAYGNEASLGTHYSKASLIIHIHAWCDSTKARDPLPSPSSDVTLVVDDHPLKKLMTYCYFRCARCPKPAGAWYKPSTFNRRWACTDYGCDYAMCFPCQSALETISEVPE